MERKQFGQLYGQAVKNKPYTKERMYQMIRENSFPHDPKRRWIIAKILQIPPIYFGVSTLDELLPKPVPTFPEKTAPKVIRKKSGLDIEEFQRALVSAEKSYTTQTTHASLKEIAMRLRYLHDEALYKTGEDGKRLRQLVCGYQMTAGNILRDLLRVDEATEHLNKAVILARENQYEELYVSALVRRGVLFLDRGKVASYQDHTRAQRHFTAALRDFQEAQKHRDHVGASSRGSIFLLTGTTLAHTASDAQDLSKALKDVNKAEGYIQQGKAKDKGIYYLDRASLFMASPLDKLHDLAGTFEALEEAANSIHPDMPRLYAYMLITEASAHLEKKWYPTATQTANEALMQLKTLQSSLNIARLATIHQRLQASDYGNSMEVAELGIELLKVQYPYLFQ